MPETLLPRIAAGDPDAVQACIRRYGGLVWSLALRMSRSREDAEDAVQEIFISLWKSADRFDPSRATEVTFIAMVARRRLIDRRRAAQRRPEEATLNLYPPYVGAGIRVADVTADFSRWDVEMRLTRFNRNYFGTHFGGSLYAMCDPFYLLIVTKSLGPEYIVWDKEAVIRFKRPGRGRVRARFEVSRDRLDAIRDEADRKRKVEPVFFAEVRDEADRIVAEIEKRIYVRKKGPYSVDQFSAP